LIRRSPTRGRESVSSKQEGRKEATRAHAITQLF
jgi:hypothetical protein